MGEIIENINLTALVFCLATVLAIKFHGDNEPSFFIVALESMVLLTSIVTFFVSLIVLIWI